MKKNILALLALTTVLLLSGCSASSSDSMSTESATVTTTTAPEASYDTVGTTFASQPGETLKLVYIGDLTLETTDFDGVAQGLSDLVSQYEGYFSSSNVNQYGSNYRYGQYTVRIPSEFFDAFHQQVGELCLVTRDRTTVEDISATYYDTQGRLETQQIKMERLQALLEKAENMEDLITIESAISETQWEIDNLSGEMNYYDSVVDYATIDITVEEVYQLSNVQDAPKTFAQRIGNGLAQGGTDFVTGLENMVVGLAYHWATLLLLAVMIVVGIKVTPYVKKIYLKKQHESDDETE